MIELHEKTVIVTGAGRGIGRAVAGYLAELGANVVVNDLDTALLDSLVENISAQGGKASAVAGSVSDWRFATRLIEAAQNTFGGLDALINNAGLHYVSDPRSESAQAIKQLVEVNVLGSIYCGLAALKVFNQQARGSLINLTSAAHLGVENQAVYSATKGAIASLTYSWSLDAKPYGVRVNAIAPLADTRMIDALPQFRTDDLQAAIAIAPLFAYLVSEQSAFISGQLIRFNGKELSLINHPQISEATIAHPQWDVAKMHDVFSQKLQSHFSATGIQ